MAKSVPVAEAVGMVLPHDITEIRAGEFKGRAFKKGHVIRPEDIDHLRRLGKEHIFVLELSENDIHENEAAQLLAAALAGPGVAAEGEPVEGKIALLAAHPGVLRVEREALYRFNLLGEVMCATLHGDTLVAQGEQVAATRLIPLTTRRDIVDQAVAIAQECGGIVRIEPLRAARAGLVITGNEVYHGRIKDAFEPVLREKLTAIGSRVVRVVKAPDDTGMIAAAIGECLAAGADLIVTSGGMSVDPDDVTRGGIAQAGAGELVYGTPVLPGAMFLVGYLPGDSGQQIPVLGLPACGMFHRITVFDLILPRVLAGEKISRETMAALGHGGLCRNCKKCTYPVCPFGK
ncbi:molybdopterin-binding protein [Desulfurivibrio sp. D14AmB]|uniref:molybdopterin-binding protein n=1 Tax=Desulfurivibrio sp. D14AmB TaxID=3374370 RepID=UPI00376EA89A